MRAMLAAGFILLSGLSALATDYGVPVEPPIASGVVSPLQNRQAQDVARSRDCWRTCQMQCKTEFLACGYERSGTECLSQTNACDRACQRECRSTWNPLLKFGQ